MSIYPQRLIDLLRLHSTVIDADMRMSFCRALVLLRHKGLLDLTDLLQVPFFAGIDFYNGQNLLLIFLFTAVVF